MLHRYDEKPAGNALIETLPIGSKFILKDRRVFKKMEQLRKRIKCIEVATGKIYLFSPVYEVEIVDK